MTLTQTSTATETKATPNPWLTNTMQNFSFILFPLLAIICLLGLWQWLSAIGKTGQIPGPLQVVQDTWPLITKPKAGEYWLYLGGDCGRVRGHCDWFGETIAPRL
jgi:hypothetical protein